MSESTCSHRAAVRRNAMVLAATCMAFVAAFTQAAGAQSSGAAPSCDPNASLNILAYREQNTLDPGKSVGPQSDATRYWIYDVLIRVTPEGSLAPGLATSWKFVSPTVMRVT